MQKKITDSENLTKSFTRRYIYNGSNIFAEFDGYNNMLAQYTHSPLKPDDVLSVQITSAGASAGLAQSGGKYYYLKDLLGSITDITNSSGNVIQKYEYSAYGKIYAIRDSAGNDVTSSPVVNTNFTYTGREWDAESGMYYYRARYYDANTGRFLQVDPDPGKLSNPSTFLSKYAYAGNNPVMNSDPSGRFFFLVPILAFVGELVVAAMISGAIAGAISGLVAGIIAYSYGGDFLSAFGAGFTSGFVQGAIGGALGFGVGAAAAALNVSANTAQLLGGLIVGAWGGAQAYNASGGQLGWALPGFAGGYVGGSLVAGSGYNAYGNMISNIEAAATHSVSTPLSSSYDKAVVSPIEVYVPSPDEIFKNWKQKDIQLSPAR